MGSTKGGSSSSAAKRALEKEESPWRRCSKRSSAQEQNELRCAHTRTKAPEAAALLRHRRASGDHTAGTDCGEYGQSISQAEAGQRGGHVSASVARNGARPNAGRARSEEH